MGERQAYIHFCMKIEDCLNFKHFHWQQILKLDSYCNSNISALWEFLKKKTHIHFSLAIFSITGFRDQIIQQCLLWAFTASNAHIKNINHTVCSVMINYTLYWKMVSWSLQKEVMIFFDLTINCSKGNEAQTLLNVYLSPFLLKHYTSSPISFKNLTPLLQLLSGF